MNQDYHPTGRSQNTPNQWCVLRASTQKQVETESSLGQLSTKQPLNSHQACWEQKPPLWDDTNRLATRIIGDKTTILTQVNDKPLRNSLNLSLKSKTHKQ